MEKIYGKALKEVLKDQFKKLDDTFRVNNKMAQKLFSPNGYAYSKVFDGYECGVVVEPSRSADAYCFFLNWIWYPVGEVHKIEDITELGSDNVILPSAWIRAELAYEAGNNNRRNELPSVWRFIPESQAINDAFIELSISNVPTEEERIKHVKQWIALLESEKNDYSKAVSIIEPVVIDMFLDVKNCAYPFFERLASNIDKCVTVENSLK